MDQKTKILVVDDDKLVLEVVSEILAHQDYEIFLAGNGQEALDSVAKDKPDIIILDIMMPLVDGLEVSRRLKSDPETANIPIIMLTARTGISDKFDGFNAGADEYVSKPFNPQLLRDRVANLARRNKAKP